MLGTTVAEVQADRIEAARDFARRHRVHLALKGAGTVVAAPDGRVFVNPTGNPGHGDGRLGRRAHRHDRRLPRARPRSARRRSRRACYLHGLAGDLAAAERGEEGLIAGDIVEAIAAAMKALGARAMR